MSGDAHLDYWLGHDVLRSTATLAAPFRPRPMVCYGCQFCPEFWTDWYPAGDEGLAVDLIRRHQLYDCPDSIAAGPLPAAPRPPEWASHVPMLEMTS